MEERHRRPLDHHLLEGPGVRCEAARVLLRARHSNPDAALDRLRPEAFRHQDGRPRSDDGHRPRLYLAHLVCGDEVKKHEQGVAESSFSVSSDFSCSNPLVQFAGKEPMKTGIQQAETERTDAALYAVASAL